MRRPRPLVDNVKGLPEHDCAHEAAAGAGAIPHDTYGSSQWMRLKCRHCGRTFSERQGTPFFRARISEEKVIQILLMTSRGLSIRATAREMGVDQNTVLRVVRVAGEHSLWFRENVVARFQLAEEDAEGILTYILQRKGARAARDALHARRNAPMTEETLAFAMKRHIARHDRTASSAPCACGCHAGSAGSPSNSSTPTEVRRPAPISNPMMLATRDAPPADQEVEK